MHTDRATRMSTEHGLPLSRLSFAVAVAFCGGLAVWQAGTLEPTVSALEATAPTVATASTRIGASSPMTFADPDDPAIGRVPDELQAVDDVDVQRESEAAAAAIAAELEGDALPP